MTKKITGILRNRSIAGAMGKAYQKQNDAEMKVQSEKLAAVKKGNFSGAFAAIDAEHYDTVFGDMNKAEFRIFYAHLTEVEKKRFVNGLSDMSIRRLVKWDNKEKLDTADFEKVPNSRLIDYLNHEDPGVLVKLFKRLSFEDKMRVAEWITTPALKGMLIATDKKWRSYIFVDFLEELRLEQVDFPEDSQQQQEEMSTEDMFQKQAELIAWRETCSKVELELYSKLMKMPTGILTELLSFIVADATFGYFVESMKSLEPKQILAVYEGLLLLKEAEEEPTLNTAELLRVVAQCNFKSITEFASIGLISLIGQRVSPKEFADFFKAFSSSAEFALLTSVPGKLDLYQFAPLQEKLFVWQRFSMQELTAGELGLLYDELSAMEEKVRTARIMLETGGKELVKSVLAQFSAEGPEYDDRWLLKAIIE